MHEWSSEVLPEITFPPPERPSCDPIDFALSLGFTPDPMQAEILRSTTHRGILNCSRQWGKSTVMAALALHHAATNPASLTLVVSPSARQSGEFLRKVEDFAVRINLPKRSDGRNDMSLRLPNEARIVALPASGDTIRGFSNVSLLLIDEAAYVPDPLFHSVLAMLAASGGRLWLMSTPNGQRGFFYQTWTQAGPHWLKIAVPARDCPRIAPAFLDEVRTLLPPDIFSQEYECQFLAPVGALFEIHWLEGMFTDEPRAWK